ncbi:YceI family protein [Candidatus Poriferisodalis multihospitum]|uniref:YceI family protein n=1 Tax=Candidatus Poriferisodalis multihospitum TaxID=2983191 RepID=UPI002B2580EB|nr:YceI family protein [Candidatus Poriferisodalis multihospitum]
MSPRRRTVVTVLVLLAIVAAAAIVGVWRVLGDAPEEVSLAEAVEVAEQAQENPDPPASPTTAAASSEVAGNDDAAPDAADGDAAGVDDGDSAGVSGASDGDSDAAAAADAAMTSTAELDGTWAVDAETGEFTLDDATGSFAGFRVDEELARIGAFTAVGRTGDVSGTLVIAEESVTSVEIEVDLTTLRTDDSRRDGAVQRALGTSQHPTATFSLTEELHIDGAVELGGSISLMASGDLTVNGITQPVTIDIEAQFVGSVIAVVGSVEITFADFDVTVPQVPIVLSAEDHGIMEFQLLFRRS